MVERPGAHAHVRGPGRPLPARRRWYFRQDDASVGDDAHWYPSVDLSGWSAIRTPHNWNATDTTLNRSSVGWYRKEFVPAQAARAGATSSGRSRFEGANYRANVWLNGKQIGGHTGGYFPFEAASAGAARGPQHARGHGLDAAQPNDLTHWRPAAFNGFGTGGWWNFGGLLRANYR